nr:rRNA 2'-O-methyltransferase fibrillarin-like [Aegilops tauschii subsp. strangulata]
MDAFGSGDGWISSTPTRSGEEAAPASLDTGDGGDPAAGKAGRCGDGAGHGEGRLTGRRRRRAATGGARGGSGRRREEQGGGEALAAAVAGGWDGAQDPVARARGTARWRRRRPGPGGGPSAGRGGPRSKHGLVVNVEHHSFRFLVSEVTE